MKQVTEAAGRNRNYYARAADTGTLGLVELFVALEELGLQPLQFFHDLWAQDRLMDLVVPVSDEGIPERYLEIARREDEARRR